MLRWLVRGILFLSFDARIVKMVNTRSGINRYGIANIVYFPVVSATLR